MSNPVAVSDPAQVAAQVAALADLNRIISVTQKYHAAVFAVAVWDWLIQLPIERQKIWKADWSMIKILYLICRYWNIATQTFVVVLLNGSWSLDSCGVAVHWECGFLATIIASVAIILLFRTWAIWGKSRIVLAILLPLYLGEVSTMLALTVRMPIAVPLPSNGPCLMASKSQSWVVTVWILMFVFDATTSALMVYKCWDILKVGAATRIIHVFMRDGVIYFFAVTCLNTLNVAFWIQSNKHIQGINTYMALSMSSICCCRMVLNLRDTKEGQPLTSASVGIISSRQLSSTSKSWKSARTAIPRRSLLDSE